MTTPEPSRIETVAVDGDEILDRTAVPSNTRRAETRAGEPTLITAAELPYDVQVRSRRRRYLIMMSMRVPLLIAAALYYETPWLALLLLVISIPLPWVAVLIANDRPPRKARMVVPGTINHERALPPGRSQVVDAD